MRMEKLVAVALVGTARHHGLLDTTTDAPVDDLTAPLTDAEPERALLLRAGAAAIYRQAGRIADLAIGAPTPTPAPAETRPVCAPGVATLLRQMFKEGNVLLPEAIDRLNHAGVRLPFDALPEALATQDDAMRARLAPALGERGRWLSHHVASWNWVEGALIEAKGELPPDADATWQEGNLKSRVALLRRARITDPDLARGWVASVWKQEKAETRSELIACYEVNLTADDEPFLEAALNDRAASVREIAAPLLARLPGSAFATRACERADAMLSYTNGVLDAKPPRDFKPEWARDGMTPKPEKSNEKGAGPRATWLAESVALVHPAHWQERFGLTPDELIAAAEKTDWSYALCNGWNQAARTHQATAWMLPLWDWGRLLAEGESYTYRTNHYSNALFAGIPADERRRIAIEMLTSDQITTSDHLRKRQWEEAVNGAPTPWDDEFSDAYLTGLRAFTARLTPDLLENPQRPAAPWLETLEVAETALAPSRVAAAGVSYPLALVEEGKHSWRLISAQRQLDDFTNTLRLRQHLLEEIPG